MNALKRLALLSLSTILLTACGENFHGTFTVNEPLAATDSKDKDHIFEPGKYSAELDVNYPDADLKVTLVDEKTKKKDEVTIEFKVPKNLKDHDLDDVVRDTIEGGGRTYEVVGKVDYTTWDTSEYTTHDSCIAGYREEYVCEEYWEEAGKKRKHKKGKKHRKKKKKVTRCFYKQVPVYGTQEVRQFDTITGQYVVFQFVKPGTDEELANFDGSREYSRTTTTTYIGPCY